MRKILFLLVFAMTCERVIDTMPGVYRCENSEAVCYVYTGVNISCKFKR